MSIQTEGNQNGCISKANTLPDKCPENSVSLQRWRILKEVKKTKKKQQMIESIKPKPYVLPG